MIPQQTAQWCLGLVGGRFLIRKAALRTLVFARYSVSGETDFVFVPTHDCRSPTIRKVCHS
jgi:hypothetical protein